jgi:hypothetical protein
MVLNLEYENKGAIPTSLVRVLDTILSSSHDNPLEGHPKANDLARAICFCWYRSCDASALVLFASKMTVAPAT